MTCPVGLQSWGGGGGGNPPSSYGILPHPWVLGLGLGLGLWGGGSS